MSNKRLYRVDEAAAYLSFSPEWIYKRIRDGVLPYIRWKRSIRLRVEDLDKFIAEHEEGA